MLEVITAQQHLGPRVCPAVIASTAFGFIELAKWQSVKKQDAQLVFTGHVWCKTALMCAQQLDVSLTTHHCSH